MGATRRLRPIVPSLFAAAVLAAAVPALGDVDSIELLVADADAVVVATLAELAVDPPDVPAPKVRAALRVTEVIKGQAPGPAPGRLPLLVPSFNARAFVDWKRQGGPRLVFLVRADRAAWHPKDAGYPLAMRDEGWALWEPAIRAGATRERLPIAVTLDLRPIFTLEQACAAAREAAAWGGTLDQWAVLRVPEGNKPRRTTSPFLYDTVRIPIDGRAERAARQWAGDSNYAEQVAVVLGHFPSDENARIVERLLDDPHTAVNGRPGKSVTWSYPVRERAALALEKWGRLPWRPALSGPVDFYRPVRGWHVGVVAACAAAFAAAVLLARWRLRRVPAEPLAPYPRHVPYFRVALAVVSLSLVALGIGSRRTVHELTASIGDSRYWLSSYQGGIQLARIRQWPDPAPLSYGRFNLRDAPDSMWNEQEVFPTDDARRAGFRRLSGTMWGDERGATYPYGSVTVPTLAVAALTALLPMWRVIASARDRARRRSRADRGCCAACGYNLHSAGDRCPECGTPRPPRPYPAT